MKKFVKGCLILAAVCAVLGGVACVTGLVLGAGTGELQQAFRESGLKNWIWEIGSDVSEESFDWEKESDVSKTLDSFSSEEIDSLEIELKYGTLDIEESDTDEVTVKVEKDQEKCKATVNDRVLKIEDTREKGIKGHNYHVLLLIPKGMEFDQIKIDNDAGTVDAHDTTLKAQSINFKVSAGEIMAERLETEKLKLRVGAGNADIDELKTSNADLTCGVGNIDVKLMGTEKDYNYQVSCGVGNISINGQDFSSLGKDKTVDHGAKKEIRLDCGVGNITLVTEKEEI